MTLPKQNAPGWNQRKKGPPVMQFLLLLVCLALLALAVSQI